MTYKTIIQSGTEHFPSEDSIVKPKLEAGIYKINHDPRSDRTWFTSVKFNHDNIVDLPTPSFKQVVKEFEYFMTPECRKSFDSFGFLYKRSTLLYGPAGTGKSLLATRIIHKAVTEGAVVFFNPTPDNLECAYKIMDQLQPETMIVVLWEELDKLVRKAEEELLILLDGGNQRGNCIYLATTNHVDRISARMKRPGRFSSLVLVDYPDAESRRYYLESKMKISGTELEMWVAMSNGLSIDELKEVTLSVKCLGNDIREVIQRIRFNRGLAALDESPSNPDELKPRYYHSWSALPVPLTKDEEECDGCNSSSCGDCNDPYDSN